MKMEKDGDIYVLFIEHTFWINSGSVVFHFNISLYKKSEREKTKTFFINGSSIFSLYINTTMANFILYVINCSNVYNFKNII
jgi:hypothetical protein